MANIYGCFSSVFRISDFVLDTPARQNTNFVCFCSRLFVSSYKTSRIYGRHGVETAVRRTAKDIRSLYQACLWRIERTAGHENRRSRSGADAGDGTAGV